MEYFLAGVDYAGFEKVESLFLDYYEHLHRHAVKLRLVEGGEKLWMASLKKSLNKTAALVIGEEGGQPVGFGHGQIKLAPDYLGNRRIGLVNHFYVDEKHRRAGSAARMFGLMDGWFKERGVHSVELQVVQGNEAAAGFWKKMGFQDELTQMRRMFEPPA